MTPLEQEISELKDELQNMFIAVNMQLEKCEEAFINYDVDLASEITNTEKRINALELKIDRDCENILALNQPVAVDLRFVLSAYKINHELERIADIAEGIANYLNYIGKAFPLPVVEDIRILEMFGQCQLMMELVIQAYEDEDTAVARKVFKKDKVLNEINGEANEVIRKHYTDESATDLLLLLSCVRKLERAGDQIKNIAEEIIFSIDSKVVKHKKNKKRKN